MDEAVLTRTGIEGYCWRQYENQLSGKRVTVLLMCGRPGPLAVHTPDVCYQAAGYHQDGATIQWPQKYRDGAASAEFSRARFSRNDATDGTNVRIMWSWGADGRWLIRANPRAVFARLPILYKLYVLQQETPSTDQANEDVCRDFLGQLLPAVDNALYAEE
jgi:hypothetical protein